jgi:hypothetical protein
VTRPSIHRDSRLRLGLRAPCAALACTVALFALPSAALANGSDARLGHSRQQEKSAAIKTLSPANDKSRSEEVIIIGHTKGGKREEVVIGGPKGSIGHVSASRGPNGSIGHVTVTGH